ncbi:hypothetical protein L7F22_016624 [Adiantum nelumboides]|nr:hypothetical protein [Adiantum nelumboides]
MKILSYNVRGLNDPTRLSMFNQWVLQNDCDVVFVQEHKLHNRGGATYHFKGYSCFYGGIQEQYSGVLTLIKNTLNLVWVTDYRCGRASVFSVESLWGKLDFVNVYASNNWAERVELWEWLRTIPMQPSVWGGDFNMVLNMNDTTSMHSVVATQEANVWDGMSTEHHLLDAWLAGRN